MRKWKYSVMLAVAPIMTGCFYLETFLAGLDLTRRSDGARECESQACDYDAWLPISVASHSVSPDSPWLQCTQEYELSFADYDTNRILTASVNPQMDLTLAVVAEDRAVHVFPFGSPVESSILEVRAVGVAWSNAGDRLAVVTRDGSKPAAEAHKLMLYDASYSVVFESVLDMPLPDAGSDYKRFFVSWSPDDSLVAISTDGIPITSSGAGRNGTALPRCQIVDVLQNGVRTFQLYNAFFIGENRLVAMVPKDTSNSTRQTANQVFAVSFNGEQVVSQERVEGPRPVYVLASHPPTGVFVTREAEAFVPLPIQPAGLRTLDRGPDVFLNIVHADTETILIVPLSDALPTLEATGFGPEDAPLPDPVTQACPG